MEMTSIMNVKIINKQEHVIDHRKDTNNWIGHLKKKYCQKIDKRKTENSKIHRGPRKTELL